MNRTRRDAPDARDVTRRMFINGTLKAAAAAGIAARLSIRDLLALGQGAGAGGPRPRDFDGEWIAESYEIAHRLRDGSLAIPSLPPEGPLHDAIVIGGGVSGLMAAWELERGGLGDVVLYEKENYVGGNARKGHANGTDYTCATWSLVRPRDPFLTRLYQDLGIVTSIRPDGTPVIDPALVGPGPDSNTLIDGTWYPDAVYDADPAREISRHPLPAKDRQDVIDFYLDMHAWGEKKGKDGRPVFAMPVEEGSADPEVRALDAITIGEYARKKGWGERALRIVDDWCTSTIGGSIGETSAYGFLSFNSLGQGGEDITLPGGNAWVADRMAAKVGADRIRTDGPVVRVENRDRDVRVTLFDPRTGRFAARRARSAVLACPKHITARMVPEMQTADRTAWKRFRYGACLVAAVSVNRTPALKGAPLGWYQSAGGGLSQGFLVGDYNSDRWRTGDPARPNVLCFWAPLEGRVTRADLLDKPWSYWADRIAADVEMMLPGAIAGVTRIDIYAWGHHMVIPVPGFLTDPARRAVSRPLGRITFAHSDRHGMPSFELATRAGHDAAREVLALVRS